MICNTIRGSPTPYMFSCFPSSEQLIIDLKFRPVFGRSWVEIPSWAQIFFWVLLVWKRRNTEVRIYFYKPVPKCMIIYRSLTLSVPVVFVNSPNLSLYFSLNKFDRIWLLIFSNWLCFINSHFLITKCHILYVLYKEKLVVDNWLALKGLILLVWKEDTT